QLRVFYTAATRGSMSQAAQELMVTPPAVTMQVKQLEETLGIRLLFREGNAMRLTPAGLEILKKARKVFDRIREMEEFLEDMAAGRSGELRIGCPQTPTKYLMPRLITAFNAAYPGIRIVLDQGSNAEMYRSVVEHRNELALIRRKPYQKGLKVKTIGRVDIVLFAAVGSAHIQAGEIPVSRISEVPLILTGEGSGVREVLLEYLHRFKLKPSIQLESASVELIKELVQQDSGVGFLERYAITDDLKRGLLREVRILEGPPVIEFGVGYLNRRILSPAAWAFLRLLDKSEDLLPFIK
ncbi:MAG: LysR family transcriptional regulator, partial [Deltaproteobacteria bacterium]|nr:LysR family transcriptional regulator [Deltaproteobacteria bacterium]